MQHPQNGNYKPCDVNLFELTKTRRDEETERDEQIREYLADLAHEDEKLSKG